MARNSAYVSATTRNLGMPHYTNHEEDPDLQQYLADIRQGRKGLSDDEERRLSARIQQGDERAVEELVTSNLPFAVSVAKSYRNPAIHLLDLIQTANIGLMRAARKFDPERGRFTTCAMYWIRQEIGREYPKLVRGIRVPTYIDEKMRVFKYKLRRITDQMGDTPTAEEIAQQLEMPLKEVVHFLLLMEDPLSLDIAEETVELEDTGTFQTPEQALEEQMMREELATLLESLARTRTQVNQKRLHVLLMRYGLGPYAEGEPYTQKAISAKLGVKQQRVQQLEKEAYREIRLRNNLD